MTSKLPSCIQNGAFILSSQTKFKIHQNIIKIIKEINAHMKTARQDEIKEHTFLCWMGQIKDKRHITYKVVQEHVVSEDGGVPDAQPERGMEALHKRHHLNRLATSYEPLHWFLDPEKHVPQRADHCRHKHRHRHGLLIPWPRHLLARHALEEDAVARDGGAGQAGAGGSLR
jgi:hypothetical protein